MARKRRGTARRQNLKFDKKWLWIGGGVLAALLVGGYALASDEPPPSTAEPEPADVTTEPSYVEPSYTEPSYDYYTEPTAPTPALSPSSCRGQQCTSACLFEELWDRSTGDLKSKYKQNYGYGGTGQPYQRTHNGTLVDCSSGYDCSGIFYAAARNAGCTIPRKANDQYNAWTQSIPESQAMTTPGAFLALKNTEGYVSHVGMSVGDGAYLIESWGGPKPKPCGSGSGTKRLKTWGWWNKRDKRVPYFGLMGWQDDAVFGQYEPFDRQAEEAYELLLASPYPPMFIRSGL